MQENNWDGSPLNQPKLPEAVDPVCGMHVDPRRSAGTRTLRGKTVFFCSTLCLEKFDLGPDHYLDRA